MRILVSVVAVCIAISAVFASTRVTLARRSLAEAAVPQAGNEVKIDNFSFGPQSVTIAAGTTATWINHDDIPHTVVSNDGVFKSKVLDTDDKFSYTFTKAGSYPYFCSIHPKMTGKVVVQ